MKRTGYAERVLIIDTGRIVADGTASDLKAELVGDHVHLDVEPADVRRTRAVLAQAGHDLADVSGVDDKTITLAVANARGTVPPVLRALASAGVDVRSVETTRPTLDDVFLTLTGRSLRDGEHTGIPALTTGDHR